MKLPDKWPFPHAPIDYQRNAPVIAQFKKTKPASNKRRLPIADIPAAPY